MESFFSFLPLLALIVLTALGIAAFAWLQRLSKTKKATSAVRSGIGGWLAFFIYVSIFVGPILIVFRTASDFSGSERLHPMLLELPGWASYKLTSWFTVAAVIAWQIWTAFRLKHQLVPQSVFLVKLFLVASPFVSGGSEAAAGYLCLGVEPGAEHVVVSLIRLILNGAWLAYFMMSDRVRNTYGSSRVAAVEPLPQT